MALLITQCLQNDFLGPLGRLDPLPNPLHVGWSESLRLLGDDPASGPLARFMQRCLEQPDLHMIHVRDWHDPADPRQRAEMEIFGRHCVAGTPGAEFVGGLQERIAGHPRSHVVDSHSLNDTLDGRLPELLGRLARPRGAEPGGARPAERPVRVGVVGVWTDVKVHYLLYELKTRFGLDHLAVCSALTASRHRRRHFEALEHLREVLHVKVIDSPGEFLEWLGAAPTPEELARVPEPPVPEIGLPSGLALERPQRQVVRHLFRDCRRVELTPLAGGFSGSMVFRAEGTDRLGYRQVPFVVKLDSRERIGQERAQFEQVENLLGANAPQLREAVDFGEAAGLKYLYASMGSRPVRPLKAFLEDLPPGPEGDATAEGWLRQALDEVLMRLYGHTTRERFELYRYYRFLPRYAENTLARAAALCGGSLPPERMTLAGVSLPSPARFYEKVREGTLPDPPVEAFASWIHGDLNLANILLDGSGNYWIIDFFHTAFGHALQDLAKLENDLKLIATPLEDDADLAAALEMEGALLEELLPGSPAPAGRPALRRLWTLLRVVRERAARLLDEGDSFDSYRIALLRYSAHSLSFPECDDRQKLHALGATGLAAARLLGR